MNPAARREGLALPPAAALLTALALALPGPASAAPPAGATVNNTAQGSARDSLSGLVVVVSSNTVTTTVQPVDGVALHPGRGAFGLPGDVRALAHVLVNTGNTTADVRLDAAPLPAQPFDPGLALVQDRDGDGAVGPGDTPVANGGVVTLAAGDSTALLLVATLPANAPANATALVSLTATTLARGATAAVTDTLRTGSAALPPALAFYDGAAFGRVTHATPLGAPLWLQASAPQCDLDPAVAETLSLDLTSTRTGDRITVRAVETGPHTGVFRVGGVPVAPASPTFSPKSLTVLLQAPGDEITALLSGCGATETRAVVWVEPGGTVFDARAGDPVPGVRVRLIDDTGANNGGLPGGLARVWQDDGVTPAPAEITTGTDGRFAFPLVRAGTYRLDLSAPAPWRVPSSVAPALLPPDRLIDASGSYGGAFTVTEPLAPVVLDVPADLARPVVLFAEKSATPAVVEWGDVVEYRLRVANRSDTTLTGAHADDRLPPGFALVPGTARAGGAAAAVTTDGAGGVSFALGTLGPGDEIELRYRARVGPDAPRGAATGTAVASAGDVRSNDASATVQVRPDAFADEGIVTGSVTLAGRDGAPGTGVAGVRLYLDDGSWAVTDAAGRYSLADVTPRTHALKLDPVTLPPGARPVAFDHRGAVTPGVRFVDVTRGDLVRADFVLAGDSTAIRAVEDRHVLAAAHGADERARALALPFDARPPVAPSGEARALPASRILTGESAPPVIVTAATAGAAAPARAAEDGSLSLEDRLASLPPEAGFVGIADFDTLPAAQLTVTAHGRAGDVLELRVNGDLVPASRVGRRITAQAAGVEACEWVGVALRPGLNVLTVTGRFDPEPAWVRVVAPGPFARLALVPPRAVPADGRTTATLVLRATDADGVRVGGRTIVTLDPGTARVTDADLDPAAPGVQVALVDGIAEVPLVVTMPGVVRLAATAGAAHAAATFEAVPEVRPLLLVGAAEGVVSLSGFPRRAPGALRESGFEAPITQFASRSVDGEFSAAAHGAVFARGRVGARTLLTMGWDSDVPADRRPFRDLQLTRGAPVVGDASSRGYDAQSTGQLYVRMEQPGSSMLFGDFTTGGDGRTLTNYSRSLTGATTSLVRGPARVTAFTSRTRAHQVVDELPGNGTSGPYRLSHAPLVENSERVEVVVRDRAQPSLVLSATTRQRFVDYELDPVTGRLMMRAPVPSVDADLNPVTLRVTYGSGDAPVAWVHGADARVKVSSAVELGGVVVDDHDVTAPFELRGLSGSAALGPHTALDGEWAWARHPGLGAGGSAGRLEMRHEDGTVQGRLWSVLSEPRFDSPGAGVTGGRQESGAHLAMRLPSRTRLLAEGLRSADAGGRDVREGVLAAVDRALGDAFRGEFGVRLSRERRTDGVAPAPGSAALRGRLTLQLPRRPEWSGYGELEQDVRDPQRRMAALGGEYRFRTRGRIYARHELLSSLQSAWATTDAQRQLSTVAGVDADVAGDAHVFGEYRMPQGISARDAQAAVGLRNGWRLSSGARVGATLERVSPLRGNAAGPSTAASASVDWSESPEWKGSSRLEVRTSRASDQFVQGMSAAVRVDSLWTGLGRWLLTLTDARAGHGEAQARLQVAMARRGPLADALGRWELRYDGVSAAGESRSTHIANIATLASTARRGEWTGSLAWAGKLTMDRSSAGATPGGGQWLHGKAARDIGRRWDAGLTGGVLTGASVSQRRWGLGLEAGRMLAGGVWLSLGANRFGYQDDELTGETWTRQGAYLRMRVKFDESLLTRDAGIAP